jgi:accessory gene regulator protein AgrB
MVSAVVGLSLSLRAVDSSDRIIDAVAYLPYAMAYLPLNSGDKLQSGGISEVQVSMRFQPHEADKTTCVQRWLTKNKQKTIHFFLLLWKLACIIPSEKCGNKVEI